MDPLYLVVLYSKFSQQSKDFMNIYNQSPVSHIKPLCIDNKDVRERIYKSKQINLTRVPSVIFIYPGNKLEHVEGPEIYDWLIQQVSNNLPQKPVDTAPPQPIDQPGEPLSEELITRLDDTPIEDGLMSRPPSSEEPVFIDSNSAQQDHLARKQAARPKTMQELAAEMAMERDTSFDKLHTKPQGFKG